MHAEFKEVRPFVHEFKLVDMPFTLKGMQKEIESTDWTKWDCILDSRYKCSWSQSTFGPIFSELRMFFTSQDFQDQILNVISSDESFFNEYWKTDRTNFKNRVMPVYECDIDKPGFVMQPHIDNRIQVIVGMCHFISEDDTKQSTTFYTDNQCSNPLRMPTGFGVGWVAANLHNTWHSGHNLSDQNRMSIKFGTQLNFK